MPLWKPTPEKQAEFAQTPLLKKLRHVAHLDDYMMRGGGQRLLLAGMSERALQDGGLSDAHEREIKLAAAALDLAFEKLISINLSFEDRVIISQVIQGALSVGYLCSGRISDGKLAQLRANQQSHQAQVARLAKKGRARQRQARLKAAIEVAANGAALVASEKFAESILDPVRASVSDGADKWPSLSTIRRTIRSILEERGENRGHS